MPLKPKRWLISPSLPASDSGRFRDFHPVVAQILYHRGYTDPGAARAFLAGNTPPGDPFKMRGMPQAVSRIRRAIQKRELIIVYGDFDADGVTSTVLMVTVLQKLGANVKHYIPHRVDEGYGLNAAAIQKLAQKGAKLIITVDCGIRSIDEVEVGRQCGVDMIVTDHHSVGPEVPRALSVINPKQPGCNYAEKMLAGVGIAYKLADALLKATAQQERREPPMLSEELLDLVAIGTVADLAPLSHAENRALVMQGLKHLQLARRPGIRALLEVASIAPETVSAGTIGFALGPRINAAGRLDSATLAYDLLSTNEIQVAIDHAQALQMLNEKRQQMTREAQAHARILAGVDVDADVPLIFAIDEAFQQGIVGLVAGRLTEEFYRPAIVMHQDEQESHGSCRSIAEFNITEALDQCADLLIRHGGHAQAAGFAIVNENLPYFRERMMDIAAKGLRDKDLRPTLHVDAEIPLRQLDILLHEALHSLEPCGHEHAAPILCSLHLKVTECRTVGRDNSHLKLKFSDGSRELDAIAFRMGEYAKDMPPYVDVAYQTEVDEWNGSRRLQLKVVDLRESTR